MAETTAEFQAVNGAVRALKAGLAGRLRRPDLAALLRASQDGERDVLRFTLVLQARFLPDGSAARPGGCRAESPARLALGPRANELCRPVASRGTALARGCLPST
jgi:hypothetical protein